jgi:hypothetical protein
VNQIPQIPMQIYFYEIANLSFLMLASFAGMFLPASMVYGFLRKAQPWIRISSSAACVLIVSILIPTVLVMMPYEETSAVNFQAVQ